MAKLTENDIRATSLVNEQKRLYLLDVADLLRQSGQFIAVACPACGVQEYDPVWSKYGMNFVGCRSCQTVFANPRPTPAILDAYYKTSRNSVYWNKYIFPNSEIARREKIIKPRVEFLRNLCGRYQVEPETLMDVGAGFGTFCEEVNKRHLFKHVIAVEPNPDLAASCRTRGLEVIDKKVEEVESSQAITVLTAFEVIEHLFSPQEFLSRCASYMKSGALIMLTCPNALGFDLSLLNELSDVVDTEHLNYFNPDSLGLLLENCGFAVLEKRTPGALDAELVRKKILSGEFDVSRRPFLKRILLDEWTRLGEPFQQFLSENLLSTHMLLVGRKI